MAHCPNCQHELPDDFGLLDCPGCGTPLFIQLDGSVEMAQPRSEAIPEPSGPEPTQMMQSHHDISDKTAGVYQPSQAFEEIAPPQEEFVQAVEPIPEPEDPIAVSPDFIPNAPPVVTDDFLETFNDEGAAPTLTKAEVNASSDLSDLSQFANSSESGAFTGSLRYSVLISGIDSADVRRDLRDLISDKKFLWDCDAILKSIRSGTVKIENLAPVKAVLLIQGLRELPVRVKWEQHVVHQA